MPRKNTSSSAVRGSACESVTSRGGLSRPPCSRHDPLMKLIAQRDDGIRVLRIESLADAEAWMPAFVGAYQAIWSEPPYNERFFPDEAAGILRRSVELAENVTLLAVRESGV